MPQRTRPPFLVTCLLAAAAIAAAAATSGGCAFDRRWRDLRRAQLVSSAADAVAATPAAPAAADPLAGRWEGRWVSERTGHRGRLRAIITPVDATTYRVTYDATYMGVLRFGYGMDLTTSPALTGGPLTFTGQEDLGALAGGVYRYNGTADGTTFRSTYESGADHGYFEMTRPKPGK